MADQLGRISVPTPVNSGLTFPLVGDYPAGMTIDATVVEHRYGELATLTVQRFAVGPGTVRFLFVRERISISDRASLIAFYNAIQGSYQSFTYNAPNPDGSTSPYQVTWETQPLSVTDFVNACRTGITFVQFVATGSAPSYSVSQVCLRFPNSGLQTALQSQTQQIIPLVHIRVRNTAVPDIYLSDRRLTLAGVPGAANPQLYLPRLLNIGEPGSDVIMTQTLSSSQDAGGGRADSVKFTFGNGDRAMSLLRKDTSLLYATIDFCLYHVQSQTLIQYWKGIVTTFTSDDSPNFTMQCSDGLYPVTLSYPRRVVTRQCWKPFNQQIYAGGTPTGYFPCPYSTHGSGGNPTSCDYYFDSPNGCLSHGMSPYFGGHPEFQQSVVIKDDGTGIIGGFLRSTVTSTSIVSDSIWGQPLPEIWCNSNGNPLNAFIAGCLVAAVRDESTYMDVFGIVGVGPIGQFQIDDPRPGGPPTNVLGGIPYPPGQSGVIAYTADGLPVLVAPQADGFPAQGFKVNVANPGSGQNNPIYDSDLGLRQVHGEDPVLAIQPFAGIRQYAAGAFSLGQGTPQHWDVPDPPAAGGWGGYTNIDTGQVDDILPLAAGTVFCELRYQKSPSGGLAPTTAESHTMSVPIAKGLTGISDLSGGKTTGLTNPFWIAVNTYLRALGLDQAPWSIQQQFFVNSSLYVGDGSGTAEIAAAIVTPLVYDSTNNYGTSETQFQFQGTLTEFKPFRDWLTEILACALGYYTFEFGQLKLGCRINASSVNTFTVGNMLYQSLSLTPLDARFEYLRIDFANMALQYQQDMVEYQDKDHETYFGRVGAPLSSRQRIVGLATASQALRLAATRTREEIGGILRPDQTNPYVEWDNALRATFKSTILALGTEVGQVNSITHPDIVQYPGAAPGGDGQPPAAPNTWPFRVEKITLHKDWSMTIQSRAVTDSMYDLDVGPKPISAAPTLAPVLFYPQPLGEWAPYQVQAPATDALFPSEYNFDLAVGYTDLADGSSLAQATATGVLPVNSFIPGVGAVGITGSQITQSTTGGHIPGGASYRIAICASDANGVPTPPSQIIIVPVPYGTNTNTITIGGMVWPSATGLKNATVYVSPQDDLICSQVTIPLTVSGTGYNPTSITLTGPFLRSTIGLPNPTITTVRAKGKWLAHGGPVGAPITSITGNVVVMAETIDITGADNWAGRCLIPIGRPDGTSIPFISYPISSFDPATGSFTLGEPPTLLKVGDACVVTFLGTDNSANPNVVSDPGLSNATNYANDDLSASIIGTFTANPTNSQTVTVGGKTYTFQTALTNVDGNVLIGASPELNLIAAVNLDPSGAGVTYAAATTANPSVSCAQLSPFSPLFLLFTALVPGSAGNSLTASGTAPVTWTNSGHFSGGFDDGESTPHSGLAPNTEVGYIIRGIAGTSRGLTVHIISNLATSWQTDAPFPTDATSVWVVEQGIWPYSVDATDVNNTMSELAVSLALAVDNLEGQPMLFGGFTVTSQVIGGQNFTQESPDGDACVRMGYVFGDPGSVGIGVTINGVQVVSS
jgi:hypothetical protein